MSPQVAADIVRLVDEFSPPSRFGVAASADGDTNQFAVGPAETGSILVAPVRTVQPDARTVGSPHPTVRATSRGAT